MSIKITTAVWDSFPAGNPAQLLVMLALADVANDKVGNGLAYLSLPKMAKMTRLSVRQVQRTISCLVDDAWLFVVADENQRFPGSAREYRLAIERLHVTPPMTSCQGGDDTMSPPDQNGIHNGTRTPSVRFEEFWTAWPNTDRKTNRKGCLDKWGKSNLDLCADDILRHIESLKSTDTWRRGFEPAPLTYLNQRRWEDRVKVEVRKDKSWLV